MLSVSVAALWQWQTDEEGKVWKACETTGRERASRGEAEGGREAKTEERGRKSDSGKTET